MTTMSRIGREYLFQLFAFAVAIFDRLLIPAILLRTLGVSGFSGWTVALAMAAFVPVLDFGLVRHFSIRLLSLRAQGRETEAIEEFRQGSLLLIGASALSTAMLTAWLIIEPPKSGDPAVDALMPQLLLPVLAATLLTQAMGLRVSLFRAHQQFGRETLLVTMGNLLRVGVICTAALGGASLVTLGWLWLAAVVFGTILPSFVDTRMRFPAFHWRWPVFRTGDIGTALRSSPGYWLVAISATAFVSAPLLALGYSAAGAMVIAQFGLMRTIANLVRQILQMFANVFGLELGRRYALRDEEGFAHAFAEANQFLGTQAAVAAVILLVIGQELFALWTGQPELFDHLILALAILPPVVLPGMMLSMEALGYAGRQWSLVRIRLVQGAATLALAVALPIDDIGLRLMAALAAGEIVGLGIPLLWAMRSVDRRLTIRLQLASILRVAAAIALSAAILSPVQWIATDEPYSRIAAGAVLGTLALLSCMVIFGLSRARRDAIWNALMQRLVRAPRN